MAKGWGSVSRKRLMENITLQYALNNIVENPSENVLHEDNQSWRQLPIDCERTAADLFATLAGTHDDNKKIMAICVEESRDHNSLTIRLAANTGDCLYAKNGFDEMARILERAHIRANPKDDDYLNLLRCIIRLDQPKIMCHLRSQHATRTRKTFRRRSPLNQLRETLNDPSIRVGGGVDLAGLQKLRAKAGNLEYIFTQFEAEAIPIVTGSQPLKRLLEIVQAAEAFARNSLGTLVVVLGSSPTIDRSTKDYLPDAIGKLARYSEASRYLVGIARKRKYSIFKHVKVACISIPQPEKLLFEGPFPNMKQAIQNVIDANVLTKGLRKTLPSCSGLGQTYEKAEREFQERVTASSDVWKIHAEIQLLVYHELNPELPKPRFIASNKSACYLCNLFLRLHGQFHAPRTHGRIYDRWLLPDWVEFTTEQRQRMKTVAEQFNSSIERTIMQTLRTRGKSYNHPNESRLFRVAQPSSSTLSIIQLATPLPSPAPSRMSLRTAVLQARSPMPSTSQISILPMNTITEGQVFSNLTSVPESPADSTVQDQRSLRTPSEGSRKNEISEKGISIPIEFIPECQEPDFESDPLVEKAGLDNSIIQRRSTPRCPPSITPSLPETLNPNELSRSSNVSLGLNQHDADLSPVAEIPRPAEVPQHILSGPGQTVCSRLNSSTRDIHIEAGKLHLTLSAEIPPSLDIKHSPGFTVKVERFDEQMEHLLTTTSNQTQEIINVLEMPQGEEITVDRGGWLSGNDLLISDGRETLVSIRYGRGRSQE